MILGGVLRQCHDGEFSRRVFVLLLHACGERKEKSHSPNYWPSLRQRSKRGIQGWLSRFQSVAQFVEWRLCRAWRNRRCAAARAARRSAVRSGTASCAVAAGVRASDDVAEIRRHFLNAENAGDRRLRRFRCTPLRRRLCLTVGRCQLRGGRRRREDNCRDDREFVHRPRARAAPAPIRRGEVPRRAHRPIAVLARMSHQGKPSRSSVCSGTAFVGSPTVQADPPPKGKVREIVKPARGVDGL